MQALLETLEEKNIPNRLYLLLQNDFENEEKVEGDVEEVDEITNFLTNITEGVEQCEIVGQNLTAENKIGEGGVNIVYKVGNFAIRKTKNEIDPTQFGIYFDTIHRDREHTFKRFVLSDPLYDIVVQSYIQEKTGNDKNFSKYIGSFYCDATRMLYSVQELNDISILHFLLYNRGYIYPEIINNIIFQYLFICKKLTEIGVTDFDRHLDNVMIKYINNRHIPNIRNRFNQEIPSTHNQYSDENTLIYFITYQGRNYRCNLYNLGLLLRPIDFGISVIESEVEGNYVEIYNEEKAYNVDWSGNKCRRSLSTGNANYRYVPDFYNENIKAKYVIQNREIRGNVMFYFFLRNLIQTLEFIRNDISTGETIKTRIRDYLTELTNIFKKECSDTVSSLPGEVKFPEFNSYYYLLRNIGRENETIDNIIVKFGDYLNNKNFTQEGAGEIKQLVITQITEIA